MGSEKVSGGGEACDARGLGGAWSPEGQGTYMQFIIEKAPPIYESEGFFKKNFVVVHLCIYIIGFCEKMGPILSIILYGSR